LANQFLKQACSAPQRIGMALVGDANLFANEAGVPTVYYGPAHETAHSDYERVSAQRLAHCAKVYAWLRWSSAESPGKELADELNGANPFDYLTELQRHSEELQRRHRSGCLGTIAKHWPGSPHTRLHNMMNPAWPERIDCG
jgi:hypothetical protein